MGLLWSAVEMSFSGKMLETLLECSLVCGRISGILPGGRIGA